MQVGAVPEPRALCVVVVRHVQSEISKDTMLSVVSYFQNVALNAISGDVLTNGVVPELQRGLEIRFIQGW